jgi:hypothetical protein
MAGNFYFTVVAMGKASYIQSQRENFTNAKFFIWASFDGYHSLWGIGNNFEAFFVKVMGNSLLTNSTLFPASKSTIGEFNAVRNTLIELTESLPIAFELSTRDKLFFSNLSIHSMHGVVDNLIHPIV